MASPKALDPILKLRSFFRHFTVLRVQVSEHGYSITHAFSVLNPVRHTRGYHQTSIKLQIRKLRYQREISSKSTQMQSVDGAFDCVLFDRSQS